MPALTNSTLAEPTLLRLLLNNLPHSAVALYDRDLRILCAGGDLLPEIGFAGAVEGSTVVDLLDPEPAALMTRWLMYGLQGEALDTTWVQGDRLYAVAVRPVHGGQNGMPIGTFTVQRVLGLTVAQASDLLEAHVRAADLKDHELMQAKARVAERILHEFRNPLAAVASSADILEKYGDTMPDENRRRHLARIGADAHRLAAILDDILTLFA